MLVCAMNPCPCGWYTDPKRECHCTPVQIQRYLSKISGPLLDRLDIHLEVPALPAADVLSVNLGENSAAIKERVLRARLLQQDRLPISAAVTNAQMNHRQIKKFCGLNEECKRLLKMAIEELNLSARAYDKILKVARTIADLADAGSIQTEHLAEAIQYRSLDRDWWG